MIKHLKDSVSFIKKISKFILLELVDFFSEKRPITYRANALLLIRLDAIGDYVLFRNFIEILRKSNKYKKYKITLCGNIAWKNLTETYDSIFIDDFIWIDIRRFIRDFPYRFRILKDIGQRGFEVALQPTYSRGYYLGDAIIKASGAKERIGNYGDLTNMESWQKKIADKYYTDLIRISDQNQLEFYRNKEFFEKLLGKEISIKRPYFNINTSKPHRHFVKIGIHTGAGWEYKRWKSQCWIKLVKHLASQDGYKLALIGSSSEQEELSEINRASGSVCQQVETHSLTSLVPQIADLDLLICLDSAPAHIASGCGISSVRLFGPTMIERWGGLDESTQVIHHQEKYPCAPCNQSGCLHPSNNCMDSITPEEVLAAVERAIPQGGSNGEYIPRLGSKD